jgi:hypothetical protein
MQENVMNERKERTMSTDKAVLPVRRDFLLTGAGLAAFMMSMPELARAQETSQPEIGGDAQEIEQKLLVLSKDKWGWMAERNGEALEQLFHEKADFVHMGGTMPRARELEVIKSGSIQYKQADIQESSVQVIGSTAIVLNRIRLLAVVGGREVTNPFVVTEVYVQEGDAWKLAALSFTKLLGA